MIEAKHTMTHCPQSYHGQTAQPEGLTTGRVLLATGEECACTFINMTVQSTEILMKGQFEIGQTVVCYCDQIGLIPGKVKSKTQLGYLIVFIIKQSRHERISARLAWQSRHAAQTAELRRAPRIRPLDQGVEVRLGEQIILNGTILDISMSGAAIKLTGAEIPFVGAWVRVGRRFATVVRLIETGIAVQFVDPFTSQNFNERVRL